MSELPTTGDAPSEHSVPNDTASRIEDLEAENEALRARLDALEESIGEVSREPPAVDTEPSAKYAPMPSESVMTSSPISRRGALAGLLGIGLLGAASTPAAAAVDPHNHLGEQWTGSPSEGFGLKVKTPDQALVGTATATSGVTAGLIGGAASTNGTGLRGHAFSDTGITTGVKGLVESPKGRGVLGKSKASSGVTFGVVGAANSTEGEGVRGHAQATSGQTIGVYGRTDSTTDKATGVIGEATDSSGLVHGVRGKAPNTPNGTGVMGTSLSDPAEFEDYTEGFGVYGLSDRRYGVFGYKPADNGTGDGAGIFGRSDTAEPAVWALATGGGNALKTTGNAEIDGDAEVTGNLSRSTGASVFLGSSQSIPNQVVTSVEFDSVVVDQRNEFDTSTHEFTCAYDGQYQVETALTYSNLPSDSYLTADIDVNGSSVGRRYQQGVGGGIHSITVSKTLYGLSAGDVITVAAYQSTGGSEPLSDFSSATYLTVGQVG